ncbi:hypothetical protein KGQ34_04600 [Patescibacteria group bacterium]|nr:hypothetical protein [Patescibacteria group bacterium]
MIAFFGFTGAIIVAIGYVPQIIHLWRFRCAWGISIWSWSLWLLASLLLWAYAFAKNDFVFMSLQSFGVIATVATIILYQKRTGTCPYHGSEK